jgi:hypothetical protein
MPENVQDSSGLDEEPAEIHGLENLNDSTSKLEHHGFYSKRSSLCGTGPNPQVANQ